MGPVSAITTFVTSAVLAFGGASAVSSPDELEARCGWRITAARVFAELAPDARDAAGALRAALLALGAGTPGFVPARCYAAGPDDQRARTGEDSPPSVGSPQWLPAQDTTDITGSGAGGSRQDTAQAVFGWGAPDVIDDFTGTALGPGWNAYDGPGHAGNGTRSPDAATVADGVLTIDGTGDGTTAGLAWTSHAQKYGRWEVRMRAPTGSPSYNALALLWPTQENFPVGGEIDFAEIMNPARDTIELFLHYGADNSQVHGELKVDATAWHNYAVEWTPDGVTAFVDGREWWKTTDTSILPPGPMHLCLQLDWFPRGDGETGQVQYDWVKQWGLAAGEGASTDSSGSEGSTDADSSTSITDEVNNVGSRR
ncbi:glycoside hydrolase, family 16 [Pseudonocardia sp. Ae263_Ps1]|nr:glycoside hydrolase, family 16 [Pseudonocardia sp. Ae263_Ps1]OLL89250.1 glycoside hydrolase, family 16 [Pseudonocardia sp. Ae356_Ps1]